MKCQAFPMRLLVLLCLAGVAATATQDADAAAAPPRRLRAPAGDGNSHARAVHTSAIQLSMRTRFRAGRSRMLAGGTIGFKLHRRHERVHIWSKPCRRLPLEQRAACERKVDAQVLKDPTWVPINSKSGPSAIAIALEHD